MRDMKVTYNLNQLWNVDSPFYEALNALKASSLSSESPNPVIGFENLFIHPTHLRYFCKDFADSKGTKFPFWLLLQQVQLLCAGSWPSEIQKHGMQVSSISCDSIQCWIEADFEIKAALTNAHFAGAVVYKEGEEARYKTFEEWNVNGTFEHVAGKVYTQLRVHNKLPDLSFCLNFLSWCNLNGLNAKLLFQDQYTEITNIE
jgi:hypothetical protein